MMVTSFQCDGPMHLKHGMLVRLLPPPPSPARGYKLLSSLADYIVLRQRCHLVLDCLRPLHHVRGARHKTAEIVLPVAVGAMIFLSLYIT